MLRPEREARREGSMEAMVRHTVSPKDGKQIDDVRLVEITARLIVAELRIDVLDRWLHEHDAVLTELLPDTDAPEEGAARRRGRRWEVTDHIGEVNAPLHAAAEQEKTNER